MALDFMCGDGLSIHSFTISILPVGIVTQTKEASYQDNISAKRKKTWNPVPTRLASVV